MVSDEMSDRGFYAGLTEPACSGSSMKQDALSLSAGGEGQGEVGQVTSPNPQSSIAFSVPTDAESQRRLARLPDPARHDLLAKLAALRAIHRATNNKGASGSSTSVASAIRQQSALANKARGFSIPSLTRAYYKFLDTADPWSLVNKSLAGPDWWKLDEQIGLPAPFVEFWRTLCERNQRKCRPAHRELLRIWRTQHDSLGTKYSSIPGYSLSAGGEGQGEVAPKSPNP